VKFVVTAALKQARQADGCSDAGRFGDRPRRAVLCRSFDQVGVLGDLAPAIFERSQIFDAVALHRLEQSLEPLASGCWSADTTVRIGISSFMVRRTAAPRALDEVSIPWNAGQMRSINDTTPSPAATGSDFATDLISAAALRWASCGFASLLRPSFWRSRRSAGCGAGAAEAPMEVDAAVVLEADVSRSIDDGEFVLGICLRR